MTEPDDSGRPVPIACSLSAQDARERVARWNALVLEAKTSARAQDGRVQADFRSDAAIREELEYLVAAERDCCPFLHFDLRESDTALTLTITPVHEAASEDLATLAPALGLVL